MQSLVQSIPSLNPPLVGDLLYSTTNSSIFFLQNCNPTARHLVGVCKTTGGGRRVVVVSYEWWNSFNGPQNELDGSSSEKSDWIIIIVRHISPPRRMPSIRPFPSVLKLLFCIDWFIIFIIILLLSFCSCSIGLSPLFLQQLFLFPILLFNNYSLSIQKFRHITDIQYNMKGENFHILHFFR